MDLTPLVPTGRRIIEAYGEGGFKISGTRYVGSLILFPERVIQWPAREWVEASNSTLATMMAEASAEALDLILIGTGVRMIRLSAAWRATWRARGMAAETMDTGAACRTYNVLLAEGRHVAAALIAVP